jgi:hypothetical protein
MNAPAKPFTGDPTLWAVVRFHGAGLGTTGLNVEGKTLLGLYQFKRHAEEEAAKVKGGFVLPPLNAWGGKESA